MTLTPSDLTPRATAPVHTRWRRIATPIPVPESLPLLERLRAAEPVSMWAMPPIVWHQAQGFLVRDPYGNQWIELTSSIVMANAGHGHPRILEAIRRAVESPLLATYAFPSPARLAVLEKLAALSPIPDAKVILFSAGTEASECAIMLMRRHGVNRHPDKIGIVSFGWGFHGRTLGAHLASGIAQPADWVRREQLHHYLIPFPYCLQCPWGRTRYERCGAECFQKCLETLAQCGVQPAQLAGIIVEPLQGWATWPMPRDFAQAMADWAKQHDILIAFDEIQAGCGRTGTMFAYENIGLVPDLLLLGKGLTSSLPASAVIGRRQLLDQAAPGQMSSTHGGNPVCAAAALANLQALEEEQLPERAARTGKLVLEALQPLQQEFPERVRSIHGPGLFISIHLKRPSDGQPDVSLADSIALEAVRRGVLMFTTGRGMLKFTPPLGIDPEAALEAAEVIRDGFRYLVSSAAASRLVRDYHGVYGRIST